MINGVDVCVIGGGQDRESKAENRKFEEVPLRAKLPRDGS